MILIGSRALMLRAPMLLSRKPSDFDFIASEAEAMDWLQSNADKIGASQVSRPKENKLISQGNVNIEFELIEPGNSADQLLQLVKEDKQTIKTPFGLVPNLDLLFTLKTSHRHLKNSPHFWKTLFDWHKMRDFGAKIRPEYKEFLKLREKETYTYNHPKLNVNKKDFFSEDQGVKYKYDHDSLHRAVKNLDIPAYCYFMEDASEVYCSKEKFFSCSKEIQNYSVVEESAVLALERSLVPFPGVLSAKQAWSLAFSKVCTSIASGWWRAFAYDNAMEILKMYPEDFVSKFEKGLKDGTVLPA